MTSLGLTSATSALVLTLLDTLPPPSNDWLPLLLPSNVRVAASQSEISLIPSAVDGSATE